MTQTIGSSTFSTDWLISTLKEADPPTFSAVSEVKTVKEISGGKGFASKVYLCSLNGHDVVLKVPEAGKLRAICDSEGKIEQDKEKPSPICEMHDREAQFYEDFSSLGIIPLPKIFKTGQFGPDAREQGFLLMESLVGRGDLGSLVDGFNKPQLLSMARDLAKFQVHFLNTTDQSWVEKYHKEVPDSTIPIMVGLFDKIKELDEKLFGAGVNKLMPFVSNKGFYDWTTYHGYKSLGLPPVLVHGNLWTNNIFWKLNKDGSVSSEVAAYIDWQLSHAGCLTSDLASVLVLCTEADVRRHYADEILKEYYDTLVKEHGAIQFSFEQVQEMYKITYYTQCFNLMFTIAFHPAMVAHLPQNVQQPQIEKLYLRCKFAIEDCIELLKSLPTEFEHLKIE